MTIEYKSEATEVAAALAETDDAIAVLPQPFVTTAMMQNDKLRIALSLTDEWNKLDNGSTLVTGVTIIRTDVLEENPAAVEKFLEEYEASINYTCLLYTSPEVPPLVCSLLLELLWRRWQQQL